MCTTCQQQTWEMLQHLSSAKSIAEYEMHEFRCKMLPCSSFKLRRDCSTPCGPQKPHRNVCDRPDYPFTSQPPCSARIVMMKCGTGATAICQTSGEVISVRCLLVDFGRLSCRLSQSVFVV